MRKLFIAKRIVKFVAIATAIFWLLSIASCIEHFSFRSLLLILGTIVFEDKVLGLYFEICNKLSKRSVNKRVCEALEQKRLGCHKRQFNSQPIPRVSCKNHESIH